MNGFSFLRDTTDLQIISTHENHISLQKQLQTKPDLHDYYSLQTINL